MHNRIKQSIRPFIQFPIVALVFLLNGVYTANAYEGFEPNDLKIIITPDHFPIIWHRSNEYGIDFSDTTSLIDCYSGGVDPYCQYVDDPQNTMYKLFYKQYDNMDVQSAVVGFYQQDGSEWVLIGTARDLDDDGILDANDNDIDGDGVNNSEDELPENAYESLDSDGDGVGDKSDPFPYDPVQYNTNIVGAVEGSLSVSQSGAAAYTIPISVPPGTAGVVPQLSLDYNSQSGNGLLGIAWSLNGLSSISRCPKTLAHDGVYGHINFDTHDRFCLDGQRLVEVPGTGGYGQDGTEYRTRQDGFSRIISFGSVAVGSGPAKFKVWTKAGDIMEFGYTADSRVEAVGQDDSVLVWTLNKVSDVYGNYFKIYYKEDPVNGEHYPDYIEYTGNDGQGLQPYNIIQFEYIDRSDIIQNFQAGSKVTTSKLLKKISTPALNYVLQYKKDGAAQRNRIQNILQCDAQNNCTPEITIAWESAESDGGLEDSGSGDSGDYTNSLPDTFLAKDVGQIQDMGVRVVDIDGDGLKDIIQIYRNADSTDIRNVYLNQGGEFVHNSVYSSSLPDMYLRVAGDLDYGVRLADINGDGLVDLIQNYLLPHRLSALQRVYLNGGSESGFLSAPHYGNSLPDAYFSHERNDMGTRMGDFNGDGLVDLIQSWAGHPDYYSGNSRHKVYINTGNGFAASAHMDLIEDDQVYIAGRKDGASHDLGTRVADINGDGLSDLIQMYHAWWSDWYGGCSTCYRRRVYINDGVHLNYDDTYSSLPWLNFAAGKNNSGNYFSATEGVEFQDINGDGLPDLLRSFESETPLAYINTGLKFVPALEYAPPSDMWFNGNLPRQRGAAKEGAVRFSDMNGDGLVDLVRSDRKANGCAISCQEHQVVETRKVYLNTGEGFTYSADYSTQLPEGVYFVDELKHDLKVRTGRVNTGAMLVDLNGDASDDLITVFHNGLDSTKKVYLNKIISPLNLISNIEGSLGDNTTIQYKPLTDQSVYEKGVVVEYYWKNYETNPILALQTPMQVVSKVQQSSGSSSSYQYEELKTHLQGLGSLGFKKIIVTDDNSNIAIETEYSQQEDFAGMAIKMEKKRPDGQIIHSSTNSTSKISTDGNGSIFAFVSRNIEHFYDLMDGQWYKSVQTHKEYTGADNGGNYGNATKVTVQTSGTGEINLQTTESRYDSAIIESPSNSDDNGKWILGRVNWVKVTNKKNGELDSNSERISTFSYDSNGILQSETVLPDEAAPLVLTTLKQHDVFGNIYKETVCDTVASSCAHDVGSFRTTTTDYDSKGRFPITVTNPLGQSEQREYDSKFGNVLSLTGPNQLTTHWYYDSFGRQKRELRADNTETTTERKFYNQVNLVYYVKTTTTGSDPVYVYFDRFQRKAREQSSSLTGQNIYVDFGYNNQGLLSHTSSPYIEGETKWPINTYYDSLGRITKVTHILDDVDGNGITNGYVDYGTGYDKFKKSTGVSSVITLNPDLFMNPRKTIEEVNSLGYKVKVTDAYDNVIQYEYDSQGNLTKTIDPENNETVISYDKRGRKISMIDPDMGEWTYEYNGYGELISQTDAIGQTTTMTYDKLGRMASRTTLEGTSTWTYGTVFNASDRHVGKLIETRGPQDNEVKTLKYDSLGRLVSTTQTLTVAPYIDSESYVTDLTYDSSGRVETITYPQAEGQRLKVKRVYASNGDLEKVQSPDGSTVYWQATQDNARGQITQEMLGNGLVTNRIYNAPTGWLMSSKTDDGSGGNVVQDSGYGFDVLGNLLHRRDHHQQLDGIVETFTYDRLNRLLTSSVENSVDPSASYVPGDFAYDILGNLITKTGKTLRYGSDCTIGYSPHAVCEVVEGGNTEIYEYDANGNMTSGGGRDVNYTSFNKPNRFTKGGDTVHFHYGAEKSRIFKVANNVQSTYVGLGAEGGTLYQKEVDTAENITKHMHFIYAAGKQAIAIHTLERDVGENTTVTKTEYFHRDHLGSPELITDQNAAVVARISYDAWGKRRNADWTEATTNLEEITANSGYTGHESISDLGLGLVHMNGRVYDPELGRFLSADPFVQFDGDLQSYNRYSYVLNNPLRYTDPSGYIVETIAMIVMAALKVKPIYIAITVASISAARAYIQTGDLSLAIRSGMVSFGSAIASGAIGEWAGSASYATDPGKFFGKAALHALSGGTSSVMLGGSFKDGAVGAFVATLGEPLMTSAIDGGNRSGAAVAGRTAIAAIVGGTASYLSGGKFANGAKSAAFKWLFNAEKGLAKKAKSDIERAEFLVREAKAYQKELRGLSDSQFSDWFNIKVSNAGKVRRKLLEDLELIKWEQLEVLANYDALNQGVGDSLDPFEAFRPIGVMRTFQDLKTAFNWWERLSNEGVGERELLRRGFPAIGCDSKSCQVHEIDWD